MFVSFLSFFIAGGYLFHVQNSASYEASSSVHITMGIPVIILVIDNKNEFMKFFLFSTFGSSIIRQCKIIETMQRRRMQTGAMVLI